MPKKLDTDSSMRYHLDDFRRLVDKQHRLYDKHIDSTEQFMSKVMEHYGDLIE